MGYYRQLSPRMPKHLRAPLRVPTLALCGADDPLAQRDDYEHARAMHAAGYDVAVVPGGHFLHRESPDAVVDALLSFILRAP